MQELIKALNSFKESVDKKFTKVENEFDSVKKNLKRYSIF